MELPPQGAVHASAQPNITNALKFTRRQRVPSNNATTTTVPVAKDSQNHVSSETSPNIKTENRINRSTGDPSKLTIESVADITGSKTNITPTTTDSNAATAPKKVRIAPSEKLPQNINPTPARPPKLFALEITHRFVELYWGSDNPADAITRAQREGEEELMKKLDYNTDNTLPVTSSNEALYSPSSDANDLSAPGNGEPNTNQNHDLLNIKKPILSTATAIGLNLQKSKMQFQILKSRYSDLTGQPEEWQIVYEGYAVSCIITNLRSSTKFRFRIRVRDPLRMTENQWGKAHEEIDIETMDQSESNRASLSLIRAIENHSYENFSSIFKQWVRQVNVDTTDRSGRTLLMIASYYGHTDMVKLLLQYGANVHATTISFKTSLMFASGNGHAATVQLLLRCGAIVDATDNGGSTALMWAVENAGTRRPAASFVKSETAEDVFNDYKAVIKTLISAGGNVNTMDLSSMTALDRLCASTGSVGIAELLIQLGASLVNEPNKARNCGKTSLMTAVLNHHLNLVEFLVNECDVNILQETEHGHSALNMALSAGHQDIISFLEKKIEELNAEAEKVSK